MMDLKKEVFVLGAKRLDFQNNGDTVQGVQVWYFSDSVDEQDIKGCIPSKAWLPLSAFPNYENREYPAKATVELDIDLAKGKLIAKGFNFPQVPSKTA